MAAGDLTNEVKGMMAGLAFYACNVIANGTTAVAVKTGMRTVINVQLTFSEAPGTGDDSELFYTVSGGTVSIDCNAACGTVGVDMLVLGHRG